MFVLAGPPCHAVFQFHNESSDIPTKRDHLTCEEVFFTDDGVLQRHDPQPVQERQVLRERANLAITRTGLIGYAHWQNSAMPIVAGPSTDPKCFIAMPVRTRKSEAETYGDTEHWKHVMEELFIPAIKGAGYEPIIPVTSGAYLIHAQIVKHLSESDLVLCDLSAYNPNVFFELGVRTSLNLPIALVSDGLADLPFDTSGINTHTYGPKLNAWELMADREKLTAHIMASADSCQGTNPMWQQFGLSLKAQEPHSDANPLEAKVDLLSQHVEQLVNEQRHRVPTRLTERFHLPGSPLVEQSAPGLIAVLSFMEFVQRWATQNGRKVVVEESLLDYETVEIRGVEGDSLTTEDVRYLAKQAREYGVKFIAHGSPAKSWDEPVNYSIAESEPGGEGEEE